MIIHDISIIATADEVDGAYNDCEDRFSSSMSINKSTTQSMRNGTVNRLEIKCGNSKATIIAKKRPQDAAWIFDSSLKFSNMNESFYEAYTPAQTDYSDNAEACMVAVLSELAQKTGGTIIASYNDRCNAVVDGEKSEATPCMYVESTGKIYANGMDPKAGTPTALGGSMSISKTLNEFIKENQELEKELKQLKSTAERVDYIGKWLINKKIDDEITYDTFKEQFMQAGLLGYKDKTCSMMYKILI